MNWIKRIINWISVLPLTPQREIYLFTEEVNTSVSLCFINKAILTSEAFKYSAQVIWTPFMILLLYLFESLHSYIEKSSLEILQKIDFCVPLKKSKSYGFRTT